MKIIKNIKPMISICLTNKNRETLSLYNGHVVETFRNFLQSLQNSCSNYELVLSNWGHSDKVEHIIKELNIENYKIIEIEDNRKFSRGYGLNIAAKNSSCNIIFFTDIDMLFCREVIDNAILHVKNGKAYFPICYSFKDMQHKTGYWRKEGFGNVCLSKNIHLSNKWDEYTCWGKEDDNLFQKLKNKSVRETVENWLHQWHPISKDSKSLNNMKILDDITIFVTSSCNFSCHECSQKTWREYDYQMSEEEVNKFISIIGESNYRFKRLLISGGEPTLWKNKNIIYKFKESGLFKQIVLYTNGFNYKSILQIEKHIDIIRISDYGEYNKKQIQEIKKLIPNKTIVVDKNEFVKHPDKFVNDSIPGKCICRGPLYYDNRIFFCAMTVEIGHRYNFENIKSYPLIHGFMDIVDTRYGKLKICGYCIANTKVKDKMDKIKNICY